MRTLAGMEAVIEAVPDAFKLQCCNHREPLSAQMNNDDSPFQRRKVFGRPDWNIRTNEKSRCC
jgi:hypothetical protein